MEINELAKKLNLEISNAKIGLKVVTSVFFGIKYAEQLTTHSAWAVVKKAGLKRSEFENLRKGINLAKNVEIEETDKINNIPVEVSERELVEELERAYNNANEKQVLTKVISFGIQYAELLRDISVRQLVKSSDLKDGFYSELHIGKNLALHFGAQIKA